MGADDRAERRTRHAAPSASDRRARRDAVDRSPPRVRRARRPHGRARSRRSEQPSCCGTATTSRTSRSRPRSAPARTRPGRRRPRASDASEGGSPHDRLTRPRPPFPRRGGDPRPRRRGLRRRRLADRRRCSSPRPGRAWPRSRSEPDPDASSSRLAQIAGPRVLRSPRSVDPLAESSTSTSHGERRGFDLSLDLRGLPPFTVSVLRELARVPYGETTTYGALAARVGHPRAARAVGTVMNRNRIPIVLPCHRVVGSTGDLTGYAGGLDASRRCSSSRGALRLRPGILAPTRACGSPTPHTLTTKRSSGSDAQLLPHPGRVRLERAGPSWQAWFPPHSPRERQIASAARW